MERARGRRRLLRAWRGFAPWPRVRRLARAYTGDVRRCDDEHPGAAGRHRRRRQSLACSGVLRRLSDRDYRAHCLYLRVLPPRAGPSGSRRKAARYRRSCAVRREADLHPRRGDRRPAGRRPCRGGSAGTDQQAARSEDPAGARGRPAALRRAERDRPGPAAAWSRRSRPPRERSQLAGHCEILRVASRVDRRPDRQDDVPGWRQSRDRRSAPRRHRTAARSRTGARVRRPCRRYCPASSHAEAAPAFR